MGHLGLSQLAQKQVLKAKQKQGKKVFFFETCIVLFLGKQKRS